ncbi:MAG: hypothetical protein KC656_34755, partial [Myxococcales bacterium]|nr:hypothetical protein [Myxococcales bacterium]
MTLLLSLLLACQADLAHDPSFAAASQDPAGTFALRVPGPMRVGEVMPLEVTVDAAQQIRIQAAVGSPGGRPGTDVWRAVPADGVRDPSAYWEDFSAFTVNARAGVARGESTTFQILLDQEVQITQPGRYAVQLETVRIEDRALILPPVAFEVLPRDPAADAKRLEEAKKALETVKGADRLPHFHALRALGDTATLDAAIAAVQSETPDREWVVVLHTHPDPDAVEKRLVEVVTSPTGVVTAEVLEALVAVRYDRAHPRALDPEPSPAEVPQLKAFNVQRAERRDSVKQLEAEAVGEVLAALPGKTGSVSRTVEAVSKSGFATADAPWRETWLAALRAHLHETDPTFQALVLQNRWEVVSDPAAAE